MATNGSRLKAMLTFCAFSGVRPGEAMALDWSDVNLPALRVHISKRLYRGQVDLPKSNQARMIALTPPARDALLTLPERQGPVFRSKSGGRLCAAAQLLLARRPDQGRPQVRLVPLDQAHLRALHEGQAEPAQPRDRRADGVV